MVVVSGAGTGHHEPRREGRGDDLGLLLRGQVSAEGLGDVLRGEPRCSPG
ncbi:hypothetical protein QJS66_22410 [Kocuria rhizophila]|nr:hypothetical protein QJS66_22410 [Kocuria rhizophila]